MGKQTKLLVVEDDPLVSLGLEQSFQDISTVELVGKTAEGEGVIKLVEQLKPDVVLMDIGLAGSIDGIEVTKRLHRLQLSTKVIIFTSCTSSAEVLSALLSGVNGYCIKDDGVEPVLLAIQEVLKGKAYFASQIAKFLADYVREKFISNTFVGVEGGYGSIELSKREIEVLRLLADGLTYESIAEHLQVKLATVKTHIQGLYSKLGCDNRVLAVVKGIRSGLVVL